MRTTLLLSLVLLVALPLAASGSYFSALPIGTVKVDVMTPVTSPRAAELTAKLQAAVQGNDEQWRSDLQSGLEWNERLGLTKEEHAELARVRGDVVLVKTGEAMIDFARAADGSVILRPDGSLPELAGVVLDLNHDTVQTPFGRATERAEVTSGEDRYAPGAWAGEQWTLDAPGETPSSGTTIKFALGQLTADGRLLIKYDAKQITPGQMPRLASCVIAVSSGR
jgi:hypothetical protein